MRMSVCIISLLATALRVEAQPSKVRLTTDKPVYSMAYLGGNPEVVTITLKNEGTEPVYMGFSNPWMVFRDDLPVAHGAMTLLNPPQPLPPGQSLSWTWKQKNLQGQPVPAATYKIRIDGLGMGLSSFSLSRLVAVTAAAQGGIVGWNRFPLSVGNEWVYDVQTPAGSAGVKGMKVTFQWGSWFRVRSLFNDTRWVQWSGFPLSNLWVKDAYSPYPSGSAKILFQFERPLGHVFSVDVAPFLTNTQLKVGATNETVETPAGTFAGCYRLDRVLGGGSYWFAPGIGLVQYWVSDFTFGWKTYRLRRATLKQVFTSMVFTIGLN